MVSSSFPARNAQSSNIPEKAYPQKESRNRSGSDGLQTKVQHFEAPEVTNRPPVHNRRERSSSEHDILADKRQKQQTSHQQGAQTNIAKDGGSAAVLKWRPGRGGGEKPPSHPQTRSGQLVEIVSMKDGQGASADSDPAGEDPQDSSRSVDSEG